MQFADYQKLISQRIDELKEKGLKGSVSKAQYSMLELLWQAGNTFPREWVDRELLHSRTQQSDYRRRLTELKDDIGVDLELNKATNHYRLKSSKLNNANPRAYLTKKQKQSLFQQDEYTCQVCGLIEPDNSSGTLQADHKVPLSRGGSNNLQNWQTLCHVCNVGKRRACESCMRDCTECPWAHPDTTGIRFVVSLDSETANTLSKLGLTSPEALQGLVVNGINLIGDKR